MSCPPRRNCKSPCRPRGSLRVPVFRAAVATLLAGAHIAAAATLTWDADGTSPVNGGTGLWNTTASNWTADGGASYTLWNNATPDSATFANTAGIISLGQAITA